MPILRIIEGFGVGLAFEMTADRVTIGRDSGNLIQIGDPKSSRFHSELQRQGSGYQLVDLGSSNGTWNEKGRIDREMMRTGSVFRIGATYMRYEDVGGSSAVAGHTIAGEEQDWTDPKEIEGLAERTELFKQVTGADARDLQRANAYLVLLHQIVLRACDVTGRDELFELLDDTAADVLEGDRCAVFLPTPDGWTLWPAHERRLRARFGATPFARTLLSQIRQRREPLLCTSHGDDKDIDPTTSMAQSGVRSAMAAPLRIGDEVHALLYVDRLSGVFGFSRTDLEFLAAVANQLAVRLHNMSNVAALQAEVVRLQAQPRQVVVTLVGKDPGMLAVDQFVSKAAPTDAPVLILGESGTGKELIARAIHQRSKRADRPLQTVNCAALAESIVESTLFGHVKGAFTGADETRPGLFELADQGTLFLDEVGELPPGVQAKLLRALEQGEVQRVGDNSTRHVDVRVIAATNRDLKEEVASGKFREDLFHRLDVLAVSLPPLRARPSDIDLLIDHFLHETSRRLNQPLKRLAPEARTLLLRYDWPGNVRQLRNLIDRACILAPDKTIVASDLPEDIRGAEVKSVTTPLISLAEVEKAHILRVLDHFGGNKKAAAEMLAIDRSTLYAKLRQYGSI